MKTKLFTIILFLTATVSFAQMAPATLSDYKPKKGSLSTEGVIYEIFNEGPYLDLPNYGFKVRYFLKDDLALRGHLNLFSTSTTNFVYENGTGNSKVGESISKFSSFTLALGAEKHFSGTDRLSTYAGADLGFRISTNKIDNTNTNVNGTAYLENNTYRSKTTSNAILFGVFTGADYYIAKKLFLGAELGFAMSFRTDNEAETYLKDPAGNVTELSSRKDDKSTNLGLGFEPNYGFRIGYLF